MDDTIATVTRAPITPLIGIALTCDKPGWHFHSWRDSGGHNITDLPLDSADYAKRFETAQAGIEYFRKRYTERVRRRGN